MLNKCKPNGNLIHTVTKLTVSSKLAENEFISKPKARIVIQAVVDSIIALLTNGQSVMLKGCGVLSTHEKSDRPGRNPKTGEAHLITARKTITFGKIKGNKNRAATPEMCSIISSLADVDYTTARVALEMVIDFIREVKSENWRVEFRGLGVFYYTIHSEGVRRNPKTGAPSLMTGERIHLRFKASKLLLDSINHK